MDEYRISESQRLHHDEVSRIRLPRHTMEIAVLHLRESRNLDNTFNAKVRSRFHILWDSALLKAQQSADKKKEEKKNKKRKRELHDDLAMGDKGTGTPMSGKNTGTATDGKDDGGGEDEDEEDELEKEKEKLRTCTVPLKAIIRQDLVDLQDEILETIQNRQLEITDDITELSVLLQKSVLSVSLSLVFAWTCHIGCITLTLYRHNRSPQVTCTMAGGKRTRWIPRSSTCGIFYLPIWPQGRSTLTLCCV